MTVVGNVLPLDGPSTGEHVDVEQRTPASSCRTTCSSASLAGSARFERRATQPLRRDLELLQGPTARTSVPERITVRRQRWFLNWEGPTARTSSSASGERRQPTSFEARDVLVIETALFLGNAANVQRAFGVGRVVT